MIYLRLILMFLVLSATFPASAATINDKGAARLKSMFTQLIADQKANIEKQQGTLTTEDQITVEQAKDYYAVTLPAFTVTNNDGSSTKIGLIAVNATPTENPENWNLSIALPSPLNYFDKNGAPLMQIAIGGQRMGGLWNGEFNTFSKLAARYNNIIITHANNSQPMSIGTIELVTALNTNAENLWDVKNKIKISGLNLNNPLVNEFMPKDIMLDLTVNKFPLTQITEITKTLTSNDSTANGQKIQALQAMMTIPQILSESGMSFNSNASQISNDNYAISMNADLKANINSIIGLTGSVDTRIKGLDKIVKNLESRKKSANEAEKQKIDDVLKNIQIIQLVAQKEGDEDILNLKIMDDGKILVNNKDISTLIAQSK